MRLPSFVKADCTAIACVWPDLRAVRLASRSMWSSSVTTCTERASKPPALILSLHLRRRLSDKCASKRKRDLKQVPHTQHVPLSGAWKRISDNTPCFLRWCCSNAFCVGKAVRSEHTVQINEHTASTGGLCGRAVRSQQSQKC